MSGKPWESCKIRGRMIENKIKVCDIAHKYATSRQMVNQVINHMYGSASLADRIRRDIAKGVGHKFHIVWGFKDKPFWDRIK